ncbi:MAG: hypothetical protein ACRDYD_03865, partial [Acidimicrobiales bacterium]
MTAVEVIEEGGGAATPCPPAIRRTPAKVSCRVAFIRLVTGPRRDADPWGDPEYRAFHDECLEWWESSWEYRVSRDLEPAWEECPPVRPQRPV